MSRDWAAGSDVLTSSTHIDDGVACVTLVGEIDAHNVAIVAAAVSNALDETQVAELVVDLGEVTFMDSSGLRAIIDAKIRTESAQVVFRLGDLSVQVRRILDVSGLLTLLGGPLAQ